MERPLTEYQWFKNLCALPFVDAIWLFGSRARGYAWERSDVDIAIICPRAENGDWHRVNEIVEEADTLLKIDAVRFDDLGKDDPFRVAIERKHVTLFER